MPRNSKSGKSRGHSVVHLRELISDSDAVPARNSFENWSAAEIAGKVIRNQHSDDRTSSKVKATARSILQIWQDPDTPRQANYFWNFGRVGSGNTEKLGFFKYYTDGLSVVSFCAIKEFRASIDDITPLLNPANQQAATLVAEGLVRLAGGIEIVQSFDTARLLAAERRTANDSRMAEQSSYLRR